jgi:CHAT domain-containing protein
MGKQAAKADPKQAIEYLKAAVDLSKKVGFRHALAWSTVELARVYRDQGDLDSAEQYATEAMEAMKEVQDQYHLPLHIALLAELENRKGNYAEADRLYDQAGDVVEGLLVNAPSRQVETSLISTVSEIYIGHFTLAATNLGDVAKAYRILETARGRAIADTLRSGHVDLAPTDSLMRAAAREVSQVQLALLQEPSAQKRSELLDRLFGAEQILAPVGKPQTPLQLATRRAEPVKLAKLETSLRPDEMVLEYVLDEPRSFCLHITRATAAVSTLPAGRKQIEDAVDSFLTQVKSKKPSAKTGQELYSLLLTPIPGAESQKRLIVVPDGKLHLLPFDSLTDDRDRYVLASHTVSYAPSASVLYLIASSPVTPRPPLSFLGVGDVQYPQAQSRLSKNEGPAQKLPAGAVTNPFDVTGERLQDVPNTRDEVIAAAQVFGARTKLLLGPDATEAAFKSQPLADFKIIHIAAHGIASPKFPDRAALVLGNDPKAGEDGLLQVREIRDLDLNADLVTLSACDTGTGQLQGEEGIANLVRAFLFAGAKSALASLWTASDVSTRTLMGHFYRHIVEGEDEATALRKAKAAFIEEFGDQALPFYWAGFILVGNASNRIALPRRGSQETHTPTPAYPR